MAESRIAARSSTSQHGRRWGVRSRAWAALAIVSWGILSWAAPSWADPAPSVRIGNHAGYVRFVYDFGSPVGYSASEADGVVTVAFDRPGNVPDAPAAPRNVVSALGGNGQARLQLSPGARWRSQVLGTRIVIDVIDAPRPARPAPARAPAPRPPAPRPPAPRPAVTSARPTLAAPAPEPAPAFAPTPAVQIEELPSPARPASGSPAAALPSAVAPAAAAPAAVAPAAAPSAPAAPAIEPAVARTAPGGSLARIADRVVTVPFGAEVGAAALRWGDAAFLVFDDRRAIDLSLLRDDPVWGGAVVQLLPEATLIRAPWPQDGIVLRRVEAGWAIAPGAPSTEAAAPVLTDGGLLMPGAAPGRVVVVPVERGRRLLVGVWRDSPGSIAVARRTPDFAVLPTSQGVVVDAVSDAVSMTARHDGFVIRAQGAAVDPAIVSTFDLASRLLDLPVGSPDMLMRRAQAEVASAARTGPQARTRDRLAAAQTMLALGLGPEAQTLLRAAAAEDPEAGGSDAVIGATAVAAVLSDRPAEAAALDDPPFAANAEAALWRALRDASTRPQEAAAALAAQGLAIEAYPDLLRRRLLPIAAETMAEGGQPAAADRLIAAHPGDPSLDLARAIRLVQSHDPAAAQALQRLASGADRRQRAQALVMFAELRLTQGEIGADAAADAMEQAAIAWRGDARELSVRLRAAELRVQAGAWRPALEALRDAEALFPDDKPVIRAHMADVFTTMLSAARPARPIDLVALAGEFPDVLPSGPAGAALAAKMADALTSLDLPGRAAPVLEGMMRAANGAARAELGARLAELQVEDGKAAAALATIAASDSDRREQWPPQLIERRALLHAQARSASDLGGAVAELSALGTAGGDDARAALLEQAGDWRGARAALADLLARTSPADAPPVVLRLATALARGDDAAGRRALREQWGGKLPPGPQQDLFRVLTAEPVRDPTELGRSAQEVRLARSLSP